MASAAKITSRPFVTPIASLTLRDGSPQRSCEAAPASGNQKRDNKGVVVMTINKASDFGESCDSQVDGSVRQAEAAGQCIFVE